MLGELEPLLHVPPLLPLSVTEPPAQKVVFPPADMLVAIGNAMAQTLEESLAIAYENNNMLKSKREELKAVDENIIRIC
jgi:hypothetical protein